MGLTVFARIRLFVVVRFLRLVFGAMSSKRALRIMNVATKPKGWQHSWMQLEPKTRSYIVGRNIANQSKEEIKMRMKNANVVIFYIHGGGFRVGSATMYMTAFVRWIKALEEQGLSCVIYSAEYRLAPEHRFPAAPIDCIECYRSVIEDYGVDPKKIIMGGDSAGGTLSLETLYHTHPDIQSTFNTVKLPRPSGLLMVSPYTGDDQTHETSSSQANLSHDYISLATKEKMAEYLPLTKDHRPYTYLDLSVDYAQILPHIVCVAVGGKEVLLDAGLQFAKRCREANLKVTLVREDSVHDYFMLGYLFTSDKNVVKRAVSSVVDLAQAVIDRQKINN
ncbi:unnamed protein product [Umbelopsis ramanniana]